MALELVCFSRQAEDQQLHVDRDQDFEGDTKICIVNNLIVACQELCMLARSHLYPQRLHCAPHAARHPHNHMR